ncbi:putative mitochondrial carrier domain-containing protein [Rosa chinensis]|uniref:Putative mitochondrial carrier domain-containing protein n=1 Tax=Rosa chinensis TaxID=74649 RepID=A0A2P6S827_ROSCH|nr:putative mitochondrial carrier domain-containing protein [Rosa chinensis]
MLTKKNLAALTTGRSWDLWTGIGPNIACNAIINAAELASYDQVKLTLLKIPGFKDIVVTHLFASLGQVGLPSAVVHQLMWWMTGWHWASSMVGPLAFYKGFIPNFGRLGSWNVIMFLTLEQVQVSTLENDLWPRNFKYTPLITQYTSLLFYISN